MDWLSVGSGALLVHEQFLVHLLTFTQTRKLYFDIHVRRKALQPG